MLQIDPTIGCSYELIDIISAITDLSREMVGLAFNRCDICEL